jgi:hypothetical protein
MRSGIDTLGTVLGDLSEPTNPHRHLSSAQIRRLKEAEHEIAMGMALGDALVWFARLPSSLRAAIRLRRVVDHLSSMPR